MRRHDLSGLMAAAMLLLALWAGVPGDRLTWAADPDFSTVTDILGGRRHLLRDDDLLVTAGSGFGVEAFRLPTADSNITGVTILDNPASVGTNNVTTTGRMFNHPSDAVLIAYQDPNFEFFLDVVLGDTGALTSTPIPHQVGALSYVWPWSTSLGMDSPIWSSATVTSAPVRARAQYGSALPSM